VKPIFFSSPDEFYEWLEQHHETEQEVYVGYWKKATGKPSLTWSQAVDQALCFGWIDGRLNRIDDERHMQRFTPRRPNSNWSNVNVEKVERLKREGRMRPAGLAAYERRREDKTGVYSFERERAALSPEQERRFRTNAEAWEWFERCAPGYRRTAVHWVVSAKREETRERRLARLIECSAEGRKVPPLAQ
jgi:uncharacterized protein YdeI (YjbR/CyaY-like superfamily)